ncbi:MAG: phospholipase D family protein [Verrucomicrobiales bacterium]
MSPVLRALVITVASLSLPACTVLPPIKTKPVSRALAVPEEGLIATTRTQVSQRLPAKTSGFLLLKEAREAFDWRLALLDHAQSSVDIQLYLWHGGASGTLLFDRALQAAHRGVRVRILVDDFLLSSNEATLASLCREHPNFEIRIFNPGRIRNSTLGNAAEMLSNFRRLNRRMHNKTFTADRSLSIVGGRNIGDHYFGMDPDYNFVDLDVLACGPVVEAISDGFDDFWNSSLAFPGDQLTSRPREKTDSSIPPRYHRNLQAFRKDRLRHYPLHPQDWSIRFHSLPRRMHPGQALFIQDHPEVIDDNRQVVTTLSELIQQRTGEVLLVSPYLIPSERSMDQIRDLSTSGIRTRILTASLEANNQALVDGHYRKIRPSLVDSGAELFELRHDPSHRVRSDADLSVTAQRVSLHAKTIVVDRRQSFIGSLNLDPRALEINTESGLWIESRSLSEELGLWIDSLREPSNSWAVSRHSDGQLQWQSDRETRTTEPPAKWTRWLISRLSGLLPIRDQL